MSEARRALVWLPLDELAGAADLVLTAHLSVAIQRARHALAQRSA